MTAAARFDVGWFMFEDRGAHMFLPPRPNLEDAPPPITRKAVQACPSVRDLQARSFDLLSPYNIDLAVEKEGDKYAFYLQTNRSSVHASVAQEVIHVTGREQWRHKDRPVIQLSIPYCFVSDEDVCLTQVAPIGGESLGENVAVIPGRFPIRNWIRPMSLALEFRRAPASLRIARNDPLCTLLFDGPDLGASARLVRAKKTAELMAFTSGCLGVAAKINDTRSAMDRAAAVRPAKLLEPADA